MYVLHPPPPVPDVLMWVFSLLTIFDRVAFLQSAARRRCALCVDQMNQRREEAAEAEQARHGYTVHISRGDRHSVSLQHFLSSSGDKTSGAGAAPPLGAAYHTVSRTCCALYSPGHHYTHIALRI